MNIAMFNRFLIPLCLLVFLTACAQTVLPATIIDSDTGALDHLISFNSDGYASLRGRISGGSQCPGEDGMPATVFIEVEMPVIVQGIETYLAVPFRITMQTEITSSLTPAVNAQDFFIANPKTSFTEAFAIYQSVEIIFRLSDGEFLASVVRETSPQDPSQAANLAGIFTVNAFSQGTLEGTSTRESWNDREGRSLTLIVAMPSLLHDAPISVLLPVAVTPATKSVFRDGQTVPALSGKKDTDIQPKSMIPLGNLRIEFTLKENTLEVSRIIELE
jgi:hypothetical protein